MALEAPGGSYKKCGFYVNGGQSLACIESLWRLSTPCCVCLHEYHLGAGGLGVGPQRRGPPSGSEKWGPGWVSDFE